MLNTALKPHPSCSIKTHSHNSGFSLLELLIALAIIAILVTIAYPSYQHHVIRAHRNNAKIGLLQLSTKLEQYYNLNHHYTGASLEDLGMPTCTDDNSYCFTINQSSDNTFTITAEAQGTQAKSDTRCANLSLDQLGTKYISGNSTITQCW